MSTPRAIATTDLNWRSGFSSVLTTSRTLTFRILRRPPHKVDQDVEHGKYRPDDGPAY
jgi:hypothetical protein